MNLRVGLHASLTRQVSAADTAEALGSGSLAVLGTPRLLAWAEEASCAAIEPALDDGATSVGSRIELQHVAPSPVGELVTVTAVVQHVDGRLVRFDVTAAHGDERVVAAGTITRVIVNADRFLSRLR
ncbi:MAG TPA: thioesterase family protein [Kribbellaceae bacterium]|nr:thioesterase family protein [Kribbellaceae bacterium]